jgi:protease-4
MKHLLPFLAALMVGPLCAADKKIIAVYDLEGTISESGQSGGSLLGFSMNAGRPLTHFDLVRSLQMAGRDAEVKGVVLDVDQAGLGLAQLQEVRRLLLDIKEAGKDVWIYSDGLTTGTALLGSAANHFVLMPEGNVALNGIYSESLYFKGLLDKVGVTADVVHIGDFKSAGETFYRTGPSEAAAKQSNELYDSIYKQIIGNISSGRGIEPAALKTFINSGFRTPEQARESKLVDDLKYRTDFVTAVRDHYGEDAVFDREYELPDTGAPEMDSLLDIFSLMFASGKSKRFRKDYVAVIILDGAISNASIAPVRKAVLKVAKDSKCKAMVLRINSPGGSALASEVLWEATDEFKAAAKPFVVSMGGVAASGGYYVAAGADKIYAEEGTITGSIGVVGMKLALGGAMEKLGITTHEFKRGEHADLMNSNRPFSEQERTLMRDSMLDVYATFKKRVTDGRGDKLTADLESLAGGRVYSGQRALELGLVDEIGGLRDALAFVQEKAGLEDPDVHLLPEPKDPFAGLFAGPDKPDKDDEFITLDAPAPAGPRLRAFLTANPALHALDPAKRVALERFVSQLEAFRNERILLLAPAFAQPLPSN